MSINRAPIHKKRNDLQEREDGRGFVAPVVFWNKLPDLPFQPKYLKCPLAPNRYTAYRLDNTLERNYKYEMLPDVDVGVNLDLIDLSVFAVPSEIPPLDPTDARLIQGLSKVDGKSSATTTKAYPWLRKPQYMTNEISNRDKSILALKPDSVKPLTVEQIELSTTSEAYRDKKVKEVLQTFEDIKLEPVHPTNPKLKAEVILPFFPDDYLWGNYYSEISFSTNPIQDGSEEEKTRKRKNSLMKATYVPNREQVYLGYFVKKRKLNNEEEVEEEDDIFGEKQEENNVEEYTFTREFKYKSNPIDPDQPPPYFFVFGENHVSYVPIKARGSMAKEDAPRRQIPGAIKLTKADELTEYAKESRDTARQDIEGKSM